MKNNDFVILVTGIPASGKSILAERLSTDLGLPWFSKDRIKEELYDTIGFASREEGAAPSPTITLEQYIASIRAREMDSFCAGGQVITVDTTDFSRVDWDKLYQEIETFCC